MATRLLGILSPRIIRPSRGIVLQQVSRRGWATAAKSVKFTKEALPQLRPNPTFKKLEQQDISYFQSILGPSPSACIYSKDPRDDSIISYNMDWMKKYMGSSQLVLRPSSTEQVSRILAYCYEHSIAVVPQGGNTGLVGGGVPVFDEVVIQMGRMDKIRSFDSIAGAVVCDAGVILEKLDDYLAERGYMCPLDLGAKGSCHIGGNVATNAGGLRLLRYGSLHGTVLGLEVVLADGTILDNLSTLRKDNTGLDLKQLFIGSEGTLGIITGVSLLTPKRPSSVNVAVLAAPSYEAVLTCFQQAKSSLSEILSAFEFFDNHAKKLVHQHLTLRNPLPNSDDSPFYILIETQGSHQEHDTEKLTAFLETLMENQVVTDGSVAQGDGQIKEMWAIREGIPEACSKSGAVYKYDISLPLPALYELVNAIRQRLHENGVYSPNNPQSLVNNVLGYGHIGDGNLHLNISASEYSPKVTKLIEPFVYEFAEAHRGSISAEHGLGVMKAPYLKYSKTTEMIHWMKKVKDLFDKKKIMNPYKYLPEH